MRMAIALAVVSTVALSLAAPARAWSLDVPHLRPPTLILSGHTVNVASGITGDPAASDTLGGPSGLFFSTPSLIVPPRYGWVLDDGRPFWYAAGASAVVALGTHVLVGIPVMVFTVMLSGSLLTTAPAAFLPVLLGVGAIYLLGQSALSSGAAALAFNATGDIYQGNYVSALAAHVAGTILGAGVSGLTFGIGALLYGGLMSLAEFTGQAGIQAIAVFSLLGALPAVVVGGIALVGVPAVIGAWALASSATAKEGYAIDPGWRSPLPVAPAAPIARGDTQALPLAAFALPAP